MTALVPKPSDLADSRALFDRCVSIDKWAAKSNDGYGCGIFPCRYGSRAAPNYVLSGRRSNVVRCLREQWGIESDADANAEIDANEVAR